MSIVIVGHFFYCPDGPTKFCCPLSKIKGIYNSEVAQARNSQKPGVSPGEWPRGHIFGVSLNGKAVVPDILVICPVDKNHNSKTKNGPKNPIKGRNCTFSSLAALPTFGLLQRPPPMVLYKFQQGREVTNLAWSKTIIATVSLTFWGPSSRDMGTPKGPNFLWTPRRYKSQKGPKITIYETQCASTGRNKNFPTL